MKLRNLLNIFALCVVYYACCFCALAQQPSGYFITEREGVPSREIYSIIEDQQGFIWIGCEAGLYKYNGVGFEYHAPEKLQSKEISGLNIDRHGTLYFINFGGQIMSRKQDTLKVLPTFSANIKQGFPSIFLDHQKNIWGMHANQLAKFDPHKNQWIHQIDYKEGKQYPLLNSMVAHQGETFLHSELEIVELKDGKKIKCTVEKANFDNDAHLGNFFLTVLKNRVALVHRLGKCIYVLEDKKFVSLKSPALYKALRKRKINAVKQVGEHEFWFLTYNGIIAYNFENNTSQEFYPDVAFSDMIEDRHGQLWLTTLKNGLLIIPNRKIWWFPKEFLQARESHINHLAYLPQEKHLYMSFLNGVIGVLEVANLNYRVFPTSLQGDISLLEVHQNRLYFNVGDTIYAGKLQNFEPIAFMGSVKTLLPQPSKNQLLLGSSRGLFLTHTTDAQNNANFHIIEKLHTAWVKDIRYYPGKNIYWIATSKGCLLLEEINGNLQNTKHLYPKKYFRKVGYLSAHFPEVGITASGEIYDLNAQKLIYKPQDQAGLLVYAVALHQKKIFLASNRGLLVWDIQRPHQVVKVSALEGLGRGEIYQLSYAQNALWAATSEGLFKIPNEVFKPKRAVSPQAFIKKIWIDGTEVVQHRFFHLNYNQSVKISLEAAAMASGNAYNILYRLSPKDKWERLSPENAQILFNPLPKGIFTLQITAEDHRQIRSKEIIEIQFVVVPPIWERWWFYVLLFVLGSLAGVVWFNISLRQLKQRQAAEAERTALQHALRISRLAALKAQIKPHFIFNVLNSIQSFIYQNDKKIATDYLGKFSSFMRQVLNYSEKEWISLEEELQLLKNYIALEAMQLEANFEYQIQTDESIEASKLLIPAFLLQPIVENVFKHAFKNKKEDKKLCLSIKNISTDSYQIIVEDNGIGRENAQKLSTTQAAAHHSFATQVIESRIALYNAQYPKYISLHTEDLKNIHGAPCGTKVVIEIKIIPVP